MDFERKVLNQIPNEYNDINFNLNFKFIIVQIKLLDVKINQSRPERLPILKDSI